MSWRNLICTAVLLVAVSTWADNPESVTNITFNAFELSYSYFSQDTNDEVLIERGCSANLTYLGDALCLDGFDIDDGHFTRSMSSNVCVYVKRDSKGWGVDIPGVWQGTQTGYINGTLELNGEGVPCTGCMPIGMRTAAWGDVAKDELFPDLGRNPSSAVLDMVLDSAKMADAAAVKAEIGGDVAKYTDFRAWAHRVYDGEAAVAASTNATISYMLGAERLFVNKPTIEIGAVEVVDKMSRTDAVSEDESFRMMTVSVVVKDGGVAVRCNARKLSEMFEVTSDLFDWDGTARLHPKVEVAEGSMSAGDSEMRFTVELNTIPSQAFLRIRK